jgi:hypothetical protein
LTFKENLTSFLKECLVFVPGFKPLFTLPGYDPKLLALLLKTSRQKKKPFKYFLPPPTLAKEFDLDRNSNASIHSLLNCIKKT